MKIIETPEKNGEGKAERYFCGGQEKGRRRMRKSLEKENLWSAEENRTEEKKSRKILGQGRRKTAKTEKE